MILAEHARAFALQYLRLSDHEYLNILHLAHGNHHDTMLECFKKWKNKQVSVNGQEVRRALVRLLTEARKDYGWFPNVSYAFLETTSLYDEDIIPEALPASSMYCHLHICM